MRQCLFWSAVLFALSALPRAASAHDNDTPDAVPFLDLGLQSSISQDGYEPTLQIGFAYPLRERSGLSCFMMTRTSYAQTYCGIYFQPAGWLSLGMSLGLETADFPGRVAVTAAVDAGRFHLFGLYEYGGSGRRHLVRATVSLGEHFLVGLMSQRFEGEGILLGMEFGRWGVYGAYLYDIERYLEDGRGRTAWYNGDFFTALLTVAISVSP